MTSLTLELTTEEVHRLKLLANQTGSEISQVLHRLISELPDTGAEPTSGAMILANLEAAGVLGTFADRPDSPEWARQLREAAERRSN